MKDPVFSANPNISEYYKTSDGNAFFKREFAETHAQSLKNKEVEKVVKAEDIVDNTDKTPATSIDDTNVDKATYQELMLFVKDNEVELKNGKKLEDVRKAVRDYLDDPNKKIVPFKEDLNND